MSEIRRNRVTGKYVRIDDEGNTRELEDIEVKAGKTTQGEVFLTEEKASQLSGTAAKQGVKANISGLKSLEPHERILRIIGASLPVAGSIGGGLIGSSLGPGGTMVGSSTGAFLGSLAQSGTQKFDPDEFGHPPENVLNEALKDASINAALDVFMGGVTKFAPKVKLAKLISKGGKIDTGVKQELILHPELEPSTSQASGSRLAGIIENLFAPFKKEDLLQKQQDVFRRMYRDITPDTPIDFTSDVIRGQLERGYAASRGEISQLFGHLRSEVEKVKELKTIPKTSGPKLYDASGKPITTQTKEIKGPIKITATRTYLNKLLKKIDDSELPVPEDAKPAIQKLRDLSKIEGAISLDDALVQKRISGEKGFWGIIPSVNEADFQGLNRALDADIRVSLGDKAKYGPNADKLVQLYSEANARNTRLHKVFGEGTNVQEIINTSFSGIEQLKSTLKDPVKIQKALNGSENPTLTRQILANEFMNDIFDQATKEGKIFNKNIPITIFKSRENDAVIRKLFSAQQRRTIERFFETIRHLDPRLPMTGRTAIAIRGAGAGLVFGPGLISAYSTGDLSIGTKTSGLILAGLTGGNALARVLLNPTTARYATQLAKTPAHTPLAQQLSAKLFAAMKGTQLMLQTPDGTIWGTATINDKGKIEANKF